MKKSIFKTSLLAALGLMLTAPAEVQASDSQAQGMHRPFYGFFLRNQNWPDYDYGFAEQYFDSPGSNELIYSLKTGENIGIYAGAAVDGIIYGCEYQFKSSMENPTPIDFVAYNIYTGRLESIGLWNDNTTSTFKPVDMTYDYSGKTMYAIGYEQGVAALYTVDVKSGKFSHVCDIAGAGPLAANAKGELYTISHDGWLKKINKSNGELEKVFNTGLTSMGASQTMEFDLTTGNIYWASNTMSRDQCENVWLQEIDMTDPADISIKELGRVGLYSSFIAMYIPYAESLDAPAAPTEITAATDPDDAGKAILTWKNPDKTFGGDDLSDISGVVIFRDGVQCKYFPSAEKGKEMQWTDENLPGNGEYRYDIIAYNEYGNGAKGVVYRYVGDDSPAAVTGVSGDVSDGCDAVTLSWTAPAAGAHGGDIDGSDLSYTIIRNPDNLTVAEGIKETTFRDDNFRRLLRYSYEIVCSNSIGSSTAKSGEFVAGPAIELPFEEHFDDVQALNNRWVYSDANNDSYTWIFGTTLGHSTFGDYETAAEYILSPTSVDAVAKDADEWLITPPLQFETGKEYEVVIAARSISEENLEVSFGRRNTIDAMTKLQDVEVLPAGLDETTGTMKITKYAVALPEFDEPAAGCVGIHLVSPLPADLSSYLQINAVYVAEKGTFSSVSDIDAENVSVILSGRTLLLSGNFSEARVYGINGALAGVTTSDSLDLSQIQPGVYIVAVATAAGQQIYKIVIQ